MIEFHRYTIEEAIRKSLMDDKGAAGTILASSDNDRVHLRISFNYEVPVKYAKAVLADYISEQSAKGGQHGTDN